MFFGQQLNAIRKDRNFTAQYMADKLNITLRSYRMYESGNRSPSIDTLVKIADILDVSLDYLLCRYEWMESHGVSFDEFR